MQGIAIDRPNEEVEIVRSGLSRDATGGEQRQVSKSKWRLKVEEIERR